MTDDKYIITTAQRGGLPNWNFLKGLESYAKLHKTKILILPTNGRYPSSTKLDQNEILHSYLTNNFEVVEGDHNLTKKLDIRFFPVKAQQMDPTTSWDRFVGYDKSAIMPSPKQRMRVVPTSNTETPKVLMSTGAITQPNYKPNSWGTKAKLDHIFGAVIVDLKQDGKFDFRQLRATQNGVFYDLGTRFDGEQTPVKERLEALIMGDYHCEQVNLKMLKDTYQLIDELNPKYIVFHDLFDGFSINHHDTNMLVYKTWKKTNQHTSLEAELYRVGQHLTAMKKNSKDSKLIVVKSNHDEVIDRYLEAGRFVDDPENIDIALKLFQEMRKGNDPLKRGIEIAYGKIPGVKFLSRDDDFKIRGWQLANHGDLGANGGRAGIRSLEQACGKAIYGHAHTPQIYRNVFVVGTSTGLKLNYNRGPSSWLNTHALLPANGQPQLINYIK